MLTAHLPACMTMLSLTHIDNTTQTVQCEQLNAKKVSKHIIYTAHRTTWSSPRAQILTAMG